MEEFLGKMAEILDVGKEEINDSTWFRNLDSWGSMAGFSILIVMEEDYGTKISVEEFLKMNTLGEIYARSKRK